MKELLFNTMKARNMTWVKTCKAIGISKATMCAVKNNINIFPCSKIKITYWIENNSSHPITTMDKKKFCLCPMCSCIHERIQPYERYETCCRKCRNKTTSKYRRSPHGRLKSNETKRKNIKRLMYERRRKYKVRYGEYAEIARLTNILSREVDRG